MGLFKVHEAEKYFYELTSDTFKQARLHAVSRGVIWSVELIPNSDTWEQYSFKLNGIIEDGFLKQHPYVCISIEYMISRRRVPYHSRLSCGIGCYPKRV